MGLGQNTKKIIKINPKIINLNTKKLFKVPNLSNFKEAEICSLIDNNLTSLNTDLLPPNITELYLANNYLNEIPDLTRFKRLRLLNIECNTINRIDSTKLPSSLEELYIGYNYIKSIKNEDLIKSLKILNLNFNELKTIDRNLLNGSEIKELDLTQNNLNSLPDANNNLNILEYDEDKIKIYPVIKYSTINKINILLKKIKNIEICSIVLNFNDDEFNLLRTYAKLEEYEILILKNNLINEEEVNDDEKKLIKKYLRSNDIKINNEDDKLLKDILNKIIKELKLILIKNSNTQKNKFKYEFINIINNFRSIYYNKLVNNMKYKFLSERRQKIKKNQLLKIGNELLSESCKKYFKPQNIIYYLNKGVDIMDLDDHL